MPDDSPLSIEGAAGLLLMKDGDDNSADTEALSGDNGTDTSEADTETLADEGNQENSASAEGVDANEETPSDDAGDTKDGDVDQGALPLIEAPNSWKAEEKEVWASLPRKAQEAIQRREQDRTNELRNLQNSNAERSKAVDAEVSRMKDLNSRIGKFVDDKVTELAKKFPELRTEADITALAKSDPGRFAEFQAELMSINAAEQAKADAQKVIDAKAADEHRATLAKAKEGLLEAFPAWSNPEVARKEAKELQDYAIKMGATEEAARNTIDPVLYKITQKAMLYDKAQAAKAAAVEKNPPRVVNKQGAGAANPKQSANAEARLAQLNKLEQSGSIEDAIGLLRA